MMETYLRSKELEEIIGLLDALNGPLLGSLSLDGSVCLTDENGECAGYIAHSGEGYVFVSDPDHSA